jgi:hypothetical protein
VIRRHVPLETLAAVAKEIIKVEPINLNSRYSTKEIPGKCLKRLAEQELAKLCEEVHIERYNVIL